ncbi:hypothetical protein EGJ52_16310 [Pseudomonas luteola]|uniref:hypothetical protein n=1 Tax=Pseudomonas luteola TaxID=47886 RepID=UPI000F7BA707|nr:hypothetical protein [Pseudomonas luteola]RRW42446.1 hypothetical protein EGJ52_16310 [Pseudomonas luteola]
MLKYLSVAVMTALLLPLAGCDKPSEQKAQDAAQHTQNAQEHQEKAAAAENPAERQTHTNAAQEQKQEAVEDQQKADAALSNESAVGSTHPDEATRTQAQ